MKRRDFLTTLPLLCSTLGAPGIRAQPSRMKLILDTDIGDDIDDAWALGFVASYAGFETLGVTVTHGNTPARAKIACKLLHVANRDDVPVFVGRQTNDKFFPQYSWAEDFVARRPASKSAADFIVEAVTRHPHEVTLLAVGPLQNVADALRKKPDLGRHLKRVVLMSGCAYGTASNPSKLIAEWNVRSSIDDARLVYAAALPLTIVPLDSTTHVRLSDAERKRVADCGSPLAYALECLYRLWLGPTTERMTLHDQLAVADAARPGDFFGRRETLPLVVDQEGYTRIDREHGKPVTVCFEPRRDEFMKFYVDELTRSQPKGRG